MTGTGPEESARPAPAGGSMPFWGTWLESALRDRIVAVADRSSPWGRTATFVVAFAGREQAVVQTSSDGAGMTARRRAAGQLLTRGGAVAVPHPLAWTTIGQRAVLVSEFLPGEPATALLGGDDDARSLAVALGRAVRTLSATPTDGLDLSTVWSDPAALESELRSWLRVVRDRLTPDAWHRLSAEVERVPELVRDKPAVLSHGDVVPVNLLIDGDAVGLLDFERARIATAIYDVARTRWVVRRFHPERWGVMEHVFLDEAGCAEAFASPVALDRIGLAQVLEEAAEEVRRGGPADASLELAGAVAALGPRLGREGARPREPRPPRTSGG